MSYILEIIRIFVSVFVSYQCPYQCMCYIGNEWVWYFHGISSQIAWICVFFCMWILRSWTFVAYLEIRICVCRLWELGLPCDTTQLDKEIIKDTTNTSQLSQSSQHPIQGPTKLQKDLSKRRTEHRSEHHQMFFLLVFLKEKFM